MQMKEVVQAYLINQVSVKKEYGIVQKLLNERFCKQVMNSRKMVGGLTIQELKKSEKIRIEVEEICRDIVRQETNDKFKTAERLKKFLAYMNEVYAINFNIEDLFPKLYSTSVERQIDLLKNLHRPKKIGDLASMYLSSEKTIRQDLLTLIDGTTLLDEPVQIRYKQDSKRGEYVYESSVHPIFLTLNLTQLMALIIGLKELAGNRARGEDNIWDELADKIYKQLSDYGQEKINTKAQEQGITFNTNKVRAGYINERGYIDVDIERKIIYAYKSGQKAMVTYEKDYKLYEVDACVAYDLVQKNVILKDDRSGIEILNIPLSQIKSIAVDYK